VPELYTAATRDEMDRLLLARVALFVDTLGYDPKTSRCSHPRAMTWRASAS